MKKGRFSKLEIAYVKTHANDGPEAVATALNRSVASVKKMIDLYVTLVTPRQEVEVVQDEAAVAPTIKGIDLFGRQSGAVVMTKAASERIDSNRASGSHNLNPDQVHRPLSN